MDPDEFLMRLSPLGVQWMVEWWCITSMANHVFNDNYVPLIGFLHCSYYSPGHIARQFGDSQGIPNDDGIFHISIFTERVLGRICTWLKRMVTKDICFPWFLHPNSVTRLGLLLIWGRFVWKRKITESPTKGRGSIDYLDMPQILLFCTLWFSCIYILNLIKDWNVPNPLWKQFSIF